MSLKRNPVIHVAISQSVWDVNATSNESSVISIVWDEKKKKESAKPTFFLFLAENEFRQKGWAVFVELILVADITDHSFSIISLWFMEWHSSLFDFRHNNLQTAGIIIVLLVT